MGKIICCFAAAFYFGIISPVAVFADGPRVTPAIIPAPAQLSLQPGRFYFTQTTTVWLEDTASLPILPRLQEGLASFAGIRLAKANHAGQNQLQLKIDPQSVSQKEGYSLQVESGKISLAGHDAAGLFYGVQTLLQLVENDRGKRFAQACTIHDWPRFAYRGMHLDVSRHLFPVAAIKKWLGILAFYKINTFHWHLTDDQGWRIEIEKYPRLQTVAAYRKETMIGHKKELPHRFDGKRYGGFYTKKEVREIVNYAAALYITVIPEIEMPGHATAALAAYPNLGCTGGPYQTATFWGIFDEVYCAGNEETFRFLQDVLDEVVDLFPADYVHIGGDECPKTRWKACPKCQQRIASEGLKDEDGLQSYLIRRMEKYLNAKNKNIIGWDEILEGGLAPGATVMSWRGEEGGIAAAAQGHDVIMTPEKYLYLDYYQSLHPTEPVASAGYLPLQKLYNYEPVPTVMPENTAVYIKGVQANLWSEYLSTTTHAEYMMFPRMMGLAEIAWSQKGRRDYDDFLQRLRGQKSIFSKLGIQVNQLYDEIKDTVTVEENGSVLLHLSSSMPDADIYFTTNNTAPTAASQLYTGPVRVNKTTTIRAALFKNGVQQGRGVTKKIGISKATGKMVTLANPPAGSYAPANNNVLVNGMEGTHRYNDGQWVGFSGTDLEAVIDLGTVQTISSFQTNILRYHWQRMWEPTVLSVAVSADGEKYTTVFTQDHFPINGINRVRANFSPVKARYVKLFAKNKGIIPLGEYGAGGKAWLLADEFLVN